MQGGCREGRSCSATAIVRARPDRLQTVTAMSQHSPQNSTSGGLPESPPTIEACGCYPTYTTRIMHSHSTVTSQSLHSHFTVTSQSLHSPSASHSASHAPGIVRARPDQALVPIVLDQRPDRMHDRRGLWTQRSPPMDGSRVSQVAGATTASVEISAQHEGGWVVEGVNVVKYMVKGGGSSPELSSHA